MLAHETLSFEGKCTCGEARYRMTSDPLFVHCCHCRWCQRETGASFALNALIEADRVILIQGGIEVVNTPTQSGKGQKIARCPRCRVALWSNYAGAGETPCVLFGSERSMTLTVCLLIFIFSLHRSSPGLCCRQTYPR
jgi:hypothetical protein